MCLIKLADKSNRGGATKRVEGSLARASTSTTILRINNSTLVLILKIEL